LQNSSQHQLFSLIVPQEDNFFPVQSVSIEEGLSWVYVQDEKQNKMPYLGVELSIKSLGSESEESILTTGVIPNVYVLYEWDQLSTLQIPALPSEEENIELLKIPFLHNYELDEQKFLVYLKRAKELAAGKKIEPKVRSFENPTLPKSEKRLPSLENLTTGYLKQRIEYSNELFLIWQATSLLQTGVFGPSGAVQLPEAMSFFAVDKGEGQAFLLKPVLGFSSPIFNEEEHFKSHPPLIPSSNLSSKPVLIESPKHNQAFLGNVVSLFPLQREENKKPSWLTIGFDLNDLLQNLVVSFHKFGFISYKGKVLMGLTPEGEKYALLDEVQSVLKGITQPYGQIEWQGIPCYFLRMQPDPGMDLHFYLITSEKDEFALVNNFEKQVEHITHSMSVHRWIIEIAGVVILLLLLLDLSKKITDPIVSLSNSLRQVKKGEWGNIQIPRISFKKRNEIRQLCDSFSEMVEGLKEKEKVKGILNKVVSSDVAQEILKGEVHLGGEEKTVTILFADIRNFTSLTQNMPPHEVIELLNTCMTKLSDIIDENKGVIDKYIGDGIMALYGAPLASHKSVFHAVESAVQMLETLKKWNEQRKRQGLFSVEIGVGIHTGTVCVGNMGAANRLNYTVIGSNVNLASRVCHAAAPSEILITEDTLQDAYASARVEVEDKGLMSFKGFDQPKKIFKIIGIKDETA
jgi:class 3 adenylate cyclase